MTDYYKQDELWGRGGAEYQRQVLAALLHIIPGDVTTVLDAGCGDGYITNALPERFDVTGMDISETALRHITGKTAVGDVASIPFPDHSFDLVMANDVIEHLPEQAYAKGLSELCRVSKKYVIITTPHEEDCAAKQVFCRFCQSCFHVNLHQRRFTAEDMRTMLEPYGLVNAAVVLTGEIRNAPADPMAGIRVKLELQEDLSDTMICPDCGRKAEAYTPSQPGLLDAVRQEMWADGDYAAAHNRSEISGLFVPKNLPADLFPSVPETTGAGEPQSAGRIDFCNPIQRTEDLTVGDRWSRYVARDNALFTENGVRPEFPGRDMRLSLFVYSLKKGGHMSVFFRQDAGEDDRLRCYAIDALSKTEIPLKETAPGTFQLPDVISASKFGYQIDIYYRGKRDICGIDFSGAPPALFFPVSKGTNCSRLSGKLYSVFFSDFAGAYPVLTGANRLGQESAALAYRRAGSYISEAAKEMWLANKRLESCLEELLAEFEIAKKNSQAEYDALLSGNNDLQSRCDDLKSEFEAVKKQYNALQTEFEIAEKNGKDRADELQAELERVKAEREQSQSRLLSVLRTVEGIPLLRRYLKKRILQNDASMRELL